MVMVTPEIRFGKRGRVNPVKHLKHPCYIYNVSYRQVIFKNLGKKADTPRQ